MPLYLHELIHISFSVFSAFFIFIVFGSSDISLNSLIVIALIGGVLIDTDHLIDYFIAFGWKFDLKKFLKGKEFDKNKKIYVLFHGYEYILMVFILGSVTQDISIKIFLFTLGLSSLFHLLVDLKLNHVKLTTYSVIFRALHNFKTKKVI